MNNLENLANAIILKACDDYKLAYRGYEVEGISSKQTVKSCEKFFHLLNSRIDPDKLIETLKIQANYAEWRHLHRCGSCSKKPSDCIHRDGKHWTAYERKDLYCIKNGSIR